MARFVFLKDGKVIEGPVELSDCETIEQALNARYGDVPAGVECRFELNAENIARVHNQLADNAVLATMAPAPDVEKIFTEGQFPQPGGEDGGSNQATGQDGNGPKGDGTETSKGRSGESADGAQSS